MTRHSISLLLYQHKKKYITDTTIRIDSKTFIIISQANNKNFIYFLKLKKSTKIGVIVPSVCIQKYSVYISKCAHFYIQVNNIQKISSSAKLQYKYTHTRTYIRKDSGRDDNKAALLHARMNKFQTNVTISDTDKVRTFIHAWN